MITEIPPSKRLCLAPVSGEEEKEITLVLDDKTKYKVSSLVLEKLDYFKKVLSHFHEAETQVITLHHVSKKGVDVVLNHLRDRTFSITKKNLEEVTLTADYLGCRPVMEKCLEKLSLLSINIFNWVQFFHHPFPVDRGPVLEYAVVNFRAIATHTDAVVYLTEDQLGHIFTHPKLDVHPHEVFDALWMWVNKNCPEDKVAIEFYREVKNSEGVCLDSLIPWDRMHPDLIWNHIGEKGIFSYQELKERVDTAVKKTFFSYKRDIFQGLTYRNDPSDTDVPYLEHFRSTIKGDKFSSPSGYNLSCSESDSVYWQLGDATRKFSDVKKGNELKSPSFTFHCSASEECSGEVEIRKQIRVEVRFILKNSRKCPKLFVTFSQFPEIFSSYDLALTLVNFNGKEQCIRRKAKIDRMGSRRENPLERSFFLPDYEDLFPQEEGWIINDTFCIHAHIQLNKAK